MTPFLQLAFLLSIILFSAKLAGYLSTRMGQPSVLGELLIGVFLGPSLLDITRLGIVTDSHLGETVYQLGEMGVLLLMFLAGLELHLSDLAKNSKLSVLAGTFGVIVPVLLGWGAGLLTGMDTVHAVFVGLTLGATSVSISAQTLMELKVLRSRVGYGLLGAAVFDDILVILLVSIFLAVETSSGGLIQILWVIVKMILFLSLSVAIGIWALPTLARKVKNLPISQGSLTLAIIVMFVYGVSAEIIGGMAAITGSFIAGLMFARSPEKIDLENGIRSLAYGFFVPIFFVSIGLTIDISRLTLNALWIMLLITFLAVVGKILGAGSGALLGKFSYKESLQLGIGMVSRGEVGLIVAQVGVSQGLINQEVFSAVVGMVLMTTLITPPLLRASFQKDTRKKTVVSSSE